MDKETTKEIDSDILIPKDGFYQTFVRVQWHTNVSNSNVHEISFKAFDDVKKAENYYDDVSLSYAKKLSSVSSFKEYSEDWSKYLVGNFDFYKPCWVSWYSKYEEDENIHVYKMVYYETEKSAHKKYDELSKRESSIKCSCNGILYKEKGENRFYLP